MLRLHTLAPALIVSAAIVSISFAQAPTPANRQTPASTTSTQQVAPAQKPSNATTATAAKPAVRRRSVVHHYPYPYPDYYYGDRMAGWRNPGGVGRYGEYYPPGGQYEMNMNALAPLRAAGFNQGGGIPTRQEQLAAQQVGIQRQNSIQQHIDNYARPYVGYGFGVGYFGGFY
jgi:hypothetical protein